MYIMTDMGLVWKGRHERDMVKSAHPQENEKSCIETYIAITLPTIAVTPEMK